MGRNQILGLGWVLTIVLLPIQLFPLLHLASTIAVPYYYSDFLDEAELLGLSILILLNILLPCWIQRAFYSTVILTSLYLENEAIELQIT